MREPPARPTATQPPPAATAASAATADAPVGANSTPTASAPKAMTLGRTKTSPQQHSTDSSTPASSADPAADVTTPLPSSHDDKGTLTKPGQSRGVRFGGVVMPRTPSNSPSNRTSDPFTPLPLPLLTGGADVGQAADSFVLIKRGMTVPVVRARADAVHLSRSHSTA